MNKFAVINEEDTYNELSLDEIKGGASEKGKWCCILNFSCNDKNKKPTQEEVS